MWLLMAPSLMQIGPDHGEPIKASDDLTVSRFINAVEAGSAGEISSATGNRLFRRRANNDFVQVTSAEFLAEISGCVHDEVTHFPATREIGIAWGCARQENVRNDDVRSGHMTAYMTTIRFSDGVPSYFFYEIPMNTRPAPLMGVTLTGKATLKWQACDMLRQAMAQSYTLSADVETALKAACTG